MLTMYVRNNQIIVQEESRPASGGTVGLLIIVNFMNKHNYVYFDISK